jgi:hypothetical protein
LALALVVPFIPLTPVLLKYRAIHQQYGLGRSITEIEALSADLRGWVTPPEPLAVWSVPADWRTPEGAVFLGLTATLLVAAAVWAAWRTAPEQHWPSRPRQALLAVGVAALGIALVPILWGPVGFSLGPLDISVSQAYKPLSVATLLFLAWGLTSLTFRRAWHAHSVFAFYVLATLAMAVFALGPTARLAGERVLYKAPYSWLMLLPGFADGFRAPARFAMLVALCLAVAAALAFVRVTRPLTRGARTLAACAVSLGVLADSWVYPFPLVPPPHSLGVPHEVPEDAAVLELPSGLFEDAAAMYHATQHGRPTVNGQSGYAPPHHAALMTAIRDGDTGVLEVVARDRPLAVFVARSPATTETLRLLPLQSRARHVASTADHEVFLLNAAHRAPAPMPDPSRLVAIAGIEASVSPEQIERLRDGNRRTSWITAGPQKGGEELRVHLHSRQRVSGVVLSQGAVSAGFPRQLTISVSTDTATWQTVWQGPTGARTVAAALDDPLDVRVLIEFPPVEAEQLRLTQTGTSVEDEWAVAELSVLAGR